LITEFLLSHSSPADLKVLYLKHPEATGAENIIPLLQITPIFTHFELRMDCLCLYHQLSTPEILFKRLSATTVANDSELLPWLQLEALTYTGSCTHYPWHFVHRIFGPISEILNPHRRPLSKLYIRTLTTEERYIDKEATSTGNYGDLGWSGRYSKDIYESTWTVVNE